MESLAVDLLLLRSLDSAELRIAPGRVLSARVMNLLPGGRGALSLAGFVIEAQLPAHLHAGQELRLVVREVHGGRVVLGLAEHHPPASAAVAVAVPLPGGGSFRLSEREESGAANGSEAGASRDAHTVSLRYDAPALGPVDLHLRMDQGTLGVTVTLPPGDGLGRLRAEADSLRAALVACTDLAVTVSVNPRRDPLDVYA